MALYLRSFLCAFLFVGLSEIAAQQNNPTFLRWNQINTDHFRVLFPNGYDQQAQRMASVLESIHTPAAKTMGGRAKRIPILLQNQSAVSNAFVTLAPWRSEFYGMPPQDYNLIGNNDWLNLLAVHEYRHVVQYTRSKTGVNKLMYWLFGQQGLAVTAFTSAPQWFWEGDAVATETAFTNSGRGRIPQFNLLFRTNLQEGRVFNYNKQHLRSYKHNINDHYVLGYNMVSYLRQKTGEADIWERIAARAWRTPFIPFTFSRAIKKETGMNVRALYKDMAQNLSAQWKAEVSALPLTDFEVINQRSNETYTDYLYPQVQPDGSLLVWKRGIGDIDQLVQLKEGKEHRMKVLGPVNPGGQLSSEAGKVVWNEMRYDPRWQVRSYSVVNLLDLVTGDTRQLSHRSRYAGAALSPDGTLVATIETTQNYQTSLVILDAVTGEVKQRFSNPNNEAIAMPRWAGNGRVLALTTRNNKKSLKAFTLLDGGSEELAQFDDESVGYPVPYQNFVFYNSPYSGIDNVYCLDLTSGKRFQVTCARYGAFNPCISPDGKWVYYNEQSRNGMDVVKAPFNPGAWRPMSEVTRGEDQRNRTLTEQEDAAVSLTSPSVNDFSVKPYSKFRGLLNVHSWGAYTSSSLSQMNIGISSRDLLNTTSLEAGYRIDLNERTGSWHTTLSYQALYPILDLTVETGKRKTTTDYELNNTLQQAEFTWTEQSIKPTLRIPLLLTHSKYNFEVQVSNGINYTRATDFKNNIDGGGRFIEIGNQPYGFYNELDNGTLLTNEFELEASHLLRKSRRDIQSKWGQRLVLKSIGALKGSDFAASSSSATGYLFLPGFFRHHSLFGIGAYQTMKITYFPDNYLLRNQIPRPRGGFSFPVYQDFYYTSANYTMPLWYPDIAVGPFINFQRVRSNFFFDYGYGSINVNNQVAKDIRSKVYTSAGVEVRFDGNFMRLLGQFDIGFRYSYQLSNNTPYFEVLIGSFGF